MFFLQEDRTHKKDCAKYVIKRIVTIFDYCNESTTYN